MDQTAFRAMLASGKAGSSSSSGSRDAVLGGGGKKRPLDGGSSWAQHGKASTSSSSSSGLFKPRAQNGKSGTSSSSAKGKERGDRDAPSYKKYGYTDRASMRRAGVDEAQGADDDAEEKRPRGAFHDLAGHEWILTSKPGLDLSLLDASRRALLQGDDYVPEEALPQKTEEEVERELEAAELAMQAESASTKEGSSVPAPDQPPAKKQKRSRADMLRDLQAKIAAASGSLAPVSPQGEQKKVQTAPSQAAAMKGFKTVERAPTKKKKERARVDPNGIAQAHPESMFSNAAVGDRKVADSPTSKAFLPEPDDEDVDIFAGAGDYEDDLIEDEYEDKQAIENDGADQSKYFEDQDSLIPKFQTYRSPTPPAMAARARQDNSDSQPVYNPYAEDASGEPAKPQRLEGLSSSAYTARDLLAYDDAQARDEKRRLKKLKGKEKKEAMAREEQYEGSKNAEQKEKDRLNREMQEYEKYERKKGRAQS